MTRQPTIALFPTETEIANSCVEIHIELMEIWTEMESIENSVFEPGLYTEVNRPDLARHKIDLHKLSERCVTQRERFYSVVCDWFARVGSASSDRGTAQLSAFAFDQQLYDFKNRCKASPFVIEMIKGVRRELEALNHHLIPDLISVVQERNYRNRRGNRWENIERAGTSEDSVNGNPEIRKDGLLAIWRGLSTKSKNLLCGYRVISL